MSTSHTTRNISKLVQAGELDSALDEAQRALITDPENVDIMYLLAGIYSLNNKYDEVIHYCEICISKRPDFTDAHYNLAIAYSHSERHQDAIKSFNKCLKLNPDNPAAKKGLARSNYCNALAYQSRNDMVNAEKFYLDAIKINPEYFEAINNLGHVLLEQGKVEQAITRFRRLISINNQSIEAYNNLGIAYETMGKMHDAENAYRSVLKLDPDMAETSCNLGFLLADNGRTDEAIKLFNDVLDRDYGNDSAIAGIISAHEKNGNIREALKTANSRIISESSNPDLIIAYGNVSMHSDTCENAIHISEQAIKNENLPIKAQIDIHHLLGRLYDRNKNFDKAFEHFRQSCKDSPNQYDHDKHVAYIDRIIAAHPYRLFKDHTINYKSRRKLIFIVGMPRSGSTLVEQILSSHPDVFGAGELNFMNDITMSIKDSTKVDNVYPESVTNIKNGEIIRLRQFYMDKVNEIDRKFPCVIDKMPHNFLCIGIIMILFPDSRIINITRDPMDNCLSLYFQRFNPLHAYSTNLRSLGYYYLEYKRLMKYWCSIPGSNILHIKYEDIVSDTNDSVRTLLEFCNLDWSDKCVDFFSNKRFVKTPSYNDVRKPIYSSSVGRWKKYEEHLSALKESLDIH